MYHLNKFCNIIFELRKERGWTQTALAEKLGIAPQSISKWECGVSHLDTAAVLTLQKAANASCVTCFSRRRDEMFSANVFIVLPLFLLSGTCVNSIKENRVSVKRGSFTYS